MNSARARTQRCLYSLSSDPAHSWLDTRKRQAGEQREAAQKSATSCEPSIQTWISPIFFHQSINSHGVVVGLTGVFGQADLHGFVWKEEGPIVALDDLMVDGTTIKVVAATDINDRGEIAGTGVLPNGDVHAVVLIPCDGDEDHPRPQTCEYRRAR